MAYAQNVMGWAGAYATVVEPVALRRRSPGRSPRWPTHKPGDPEGLGPGMPLNAIGLPSTDPLSQMPMTFGNTETAGQLSTGPLPGPAGMLPQQPCQVICMGSQLAPRHRRPTRRLLPIPRSPGSRRGCSRRRRPHRQLSRLRSPIRHPHQHLHLPRLQPAAGGPWRAARTGQLAQDPDSLHR